jgi:hypothetical protein
MPPSDAKQSSESRRASPMILVGPAVAAAIAFLVWWTTPSLGALPAYELEIEGAAGAAGARQVLVAERQEVARVELGASRELRVLLRPRGSSTAPVDARVFLRGPGAAGGVAVMPLAAVTEQVSPGVLRVTVDGSVLPDQGRLLVLVGRSGLLPDSPAGVASHGRDWQRFDIDFSSPAQPAR